MPLSRFADQSIGADLAQILVASGSFGVGTYQVQPTQSPQGAGLVAAAVGRPNVCISGGKFLQLVVDVTNVGAAGTVTVTIFGIDPASGKAYPLLASAALGTVATTVLRVGPGLTAVANLAASDFVPLTFAVQVVVAGNAVVFSLGASQMP